VSAPGFRSWLSHYWRKQRLLIRLRSLRYTGAISLDRYIYLRSMVARLTHDDLSWELIQHLVGDVPTRSERFMARQCVLRGRTAVPSTQREDVRQQVMTAPDRSSLWEKAEAAAIVRFAGLVQLLAAVIIGVGIFGIVTAQVNIQNRQVALWVTIGCGLIIILTLMIDTHINTTGSTAIEIKSKTTMSSITPLLEESDHLGRGTWGAN